MMHGLTGNEPLALFPCKLAGNRQDTEIAFHSQTKNPISFKMRLV